MIDPAARLVAGILRPSLAASAGDSGPSSLPGFEPTNAKAPRIDDEY